MNYIQNRRNRLLNSLQKESSPKTAGGLLKQIKYNRNHSVSTIYVALLKNDQRIKLTIVNSNIYKNSENIKHIISVQSTGDSAVIRNTQRILRGNSGGVGMDGDSTKVEKIVFEGVGTQSIYNEDIVIKLPSYFKNSSSWTQHQCDVLAKDVKIFINWLNKKVIDKSIIAEIIENIPKPNIDNYIRFMKLCKFFKSPKINKVLDENLELFCYYLYNQSLEKKSKVLLLWIRKRLNIKFKLDKLNTKSDLFNLIIKMIKIINSKHVAKKIYKTSEVSPKSNFHKSLCFSESSKSVGIQKEWTEFPIIDNFLINLYTINDILHYKNPPHITVKTLNDLGFKIGELVIDSHPKFVNKFKYFTQESLEGLNWDNVIYSGGSLSLLFNPKIKKNDFPICSDLDLFVYGSRHIRIEKIKYLCTFFRKKYGKNAFFGLQKAVITIFIRSTPNSLIRNIQIVNTEHHTPFQIINNFDMSHVQVFYKSGLVFASHKFVKYYVTMCSKIITTRCIECRAYKTSIMGYNLINNNKITIYKSKKFCQLTPNHKWNTNSYAVISKLNKYYYPDKTQTDNRVMFLISRIFNISLDNISQNPSDLYDKMVPPTFCSKFSRFSGIKVNNYLQNNLNQVSNLIESLDIKIKGNIVSSGSKPIDIRLPEFKVQNFNYNPILNKNILSLNLNKHCYKIIEYLDLIEKNIINKLDNVNKIPSYHINILKQTLDILCIITKDNPIKIKDKQGNICLRLVGIKKIESSIAFCYKLLDFKEN